MFYWKIHTAHIAANGDVNVAFVTEKGAPRVSNYVIGNGGSFVIADDLDCVI